MSSRIRKLRLSHREQFDDYFKTRKPNPGPWKRLRADVWLSYVLSTKNWSWEDLKRRMGRHRQRSSLVDRWCKGEVSPCRKSAEKISEEVPGSLELFDHPTWRLIRNIPIASNEIDRLVASYLPSEKGFFAYQFPDTLSPKGSLRYQIPLHMEDSVMLYMRGDIHALALILALVRHSEVAHDDEMHQMHISNLYRLLPALGKLPYIFPNFQLLRQMIEAIHSRVLCSRLMIAVDWPLIAEQIASVDFFNAFPRTPRGDSRIERKRQHRIHKDPVIEGEIIPAKGIPWPAEIEDSSLESDTA